MSTSDGSSSGHQRGRRLPGTAAVLCLLTASWAVPLAGTTITGRDRAWPPVGPGPAAPGLPILFEPNLGQAGGEAGYVARGAGLGLALSPTGATLRVGEGPPAALRLLGSEAGARLVASEPQAARTNYFIGNDPGRWRTGVPTYAKVTAQGVYPGIDLAWYGGGRAGSDLEYDVVVAPGADPATVAFVVDGAEALSLAPDGALVARLAAGPTLRQHAPVAYQADGAGGRRSVAAAFSLEGNEVRFALGGFDRARELVIDPVLTWSTYLGGSGGGAQDYGHAVDVDAAGNVYVAGNAFSPDFPVTDASVLRGQSDIFVTKFTPAGDLVYSTVVGGSSHENPGPSDALAVSPAGAAHMVGTTGSEDFPTVNPQDTCRDGTEDAVAFKLDPTGSIMKFSTCLGGFKRDSGRGAALDPNGDLYVVGRARSPDFPVRNNGGMGTGGTCLGHSNSGSLDFADAFVTKLGPAGWLVYSTCWGGSAQDSAEGVDVDAAGTVFVVGDTYSRDFPQTKNTGIQSGPSPVPGLSGFVVGLSTQPRARFSTYVDGNEADTLADVEADGGHVYLMGTSRSTDLATVWPAATAGAYQPARDPTVDDSNHDHLVARLRFEPAAPKAPVMDRLTYLGGPSDDSGASIAVHNGAVWVTGRGAAGFPLVDPLQPSCAASGASAVAARLDAALTTLDFSTCLGGSSGALGTQGKGVAVDAGGEVYLTGFTSSGDFPTTEGAYDRTIAGVDAYVARISPG